MVKIDIGKKEVLAFVFILSIACVLGVTEWTDKPVSHEANMVKVTIQGKDYGLQDALDDGLIGGSGSIPCNWVGWKGSLTMTIHEGGKYPSTYNTTGLIVVGKDCRYSIY
jgi:hypothetical protein